MHARDPFLLFGAAYNIMQKRVCRNGQQMDDLLPLERKHMSGYSVDNAIILAAGFGSRFAPLTYDRPKGLVQVHGKPMIEAQIELLLEQGIPEILLVTGYLREKFAYLQPKYGVKLLYNPEYATKNNLATLHSARDYLRSSYVLTTDHWFERNPFHATEPYSWYSCVFLEGPTSEWCVTKQDEAGRMLEMTIGGQDAYGIVGPAFLSADFSKAFLPLLEEYYRRPGSENFYWEHILKDHLRSLPMYVNPQTGLVIEFESLEELRLYDKSYLTDSRSAILRYIAQALCVPEGQIIQIQPLKGADGNPSFLFSVEGRRYVFFQGDAGVHAPQTVALDPAKGMGIANYDPGTP